MFVRIVHGGVSSSAALSCFIARTQSLNGSPQYRLDSLCNSRYYTRSSTPPRSIYQNHIRILSYTTRKLVSQLDNNHILLQDTFYRSSAVYRVQIFYYCSVFSVFATIQQPLFGTPWETSSAWLGPERTQTSAIGSSSSRIPHNVINVFSSIPLPTFTII